ncbi:MAG: glycoside hydrolase family 16 protein [Chitinophagaceae bacterium]
MQNRFTIIILFLTIPMCTVLLTNAQKRKGWKIKWAEEFNYTGLPDAKKWGYEVGYIRNSEQQYYTHAEKENIWVTNSALTITGRKEKYTNQFYKKGSTDWRYKDSIAEYTSASIHTLAKFVPILIGRKPGRLEIKAKIPEGRGMWPALWMLGVKKHKAGLPAYSEIDIMEFIGKEPAAIYATVHYEDADKNLHSSGNKITDSTLSAKFHVYAIEWDKQKIDFYFDNIKYHSFIIDTAGAGKNNPFRK